jgi:DNA invertase Pin-like site-specific DNA recombinase
MKLKRLRKFPEALSVTIIAKTMKVSRQTVYKYLNDGRLNGQTLEDLCEFYYQKAKSE